MGIFLFTIVTLNITTQKGISLKSTNGPFIYAVPLVAIGCLMASIFVFKKQLGNAINKYTLKEKLMAYQAALIQRFAFLEGSSMFAIVVFMLTGNLVYLIITGVLMLYLLFLRPTKYKIENDLNLSYEDKIQFDSADTPL